MSAKALTEVDPLPATPPSPESDLEFLIEPSRGWTAVGWREIWRYRELLYFLAWRDIKVRYKQTALGAGWAIIQPFMTMVVLSVFFGRVAGLDQKTGGIPYPIFVYAGMLPWTLFASSVTNSSSSLIASSNLISKIYFPRLIIPFSAVGTAIVDFLVSSVILIVMMVYYRTPFLPVLALMPIFLIGTILVATATGTLLSALTVSYRDFRYVVPFIVQIWFFVTPVIFPPGMLPSKWAWALALNPMTGLIGGFRGAFLGSPIDWGHVGLSYLLGAVMFLVGTVFFRNVERRFADVI